MPLQKVNRIMTKGWPCALTALQCHLPSVPAPVDGQCHLAGRTVAYSTELMGEAGREKLKQKGRNYNSKNKVKHAGQRVPVYQSEGEGC